VELNSIFESSPKVLEFEIMCQNQIIRLKMLNNLAQTSTQRTFFLKLLSKSRLEGSLINNKKEELIDIGG
jgi:hypothetical protein